MGTCRYSSVIFFIASQFNRVIIGPNMAPEHADWKHVQTNLARGVTEIVGKKGRDDLLRRGDVLFKMVDDNVTDVVPRAEASETVIADARKAKSPWHLVHGLSTTKHAQGEKK